MSMKHIYHSEFQRQSRNSSYIESLNETERSSQQNEVKCLYAV